MEVFGFDFASSKAVVGSSTFSIEFVMHLFQKEHFLHGSVVGTDFDQFNDLPDCSTAA